MLRELPRFVESEPSGSSPYLPFPAAVERGVVDLDEIEPQTLDEPLGVTLANGRIPSGQAGVIRRGRGEILACDHVTLVGIAGDESLVVGPSSKADIDDDGEIKNAGALVLSSPEGFLKLIGVAINRARYPWVATGGRRAFRQTGNITVKLFGLESADYEVDEVEADSGLVIAKPRRSVF